LNAFNIFDLGIVSTWAALFFLNQAHGHQTSEVSNVVLLFRLVRLIRVITWILKLLRSVFRVDSKHRSTNDHRWLLFLWFFLSDGRLLVICMYIVTTAIGALSIILNYTIDRPFDYVLNPYWSCLHLVEMVRMLDTLPNVFKAITMRAEQLLHTLALGIYAMYLFGVFAFIFFPNAMVGQNPESCNTPAMCFAVVLEWGLRTDDVGNAMAEINWLHEYKAIYFIFTVLYFLLITTILLNVIFGIIVDAFGQLRDDQDQLDQTIHNECFICMQKRDTFEDPKINTTFEDHVHKEHNVWHYVCFIVQISLKPKTELTGTEQYVLDELMKVTLD